MNDNREMTLEYDPLIEDIQELDRQLGKGSNSLHSNEVENLPEDNANDYNAALNIFMIPACEIFDLNNRMIQCLGDMLYMKEFSLDKHQDFKCSALETSMSMLEIKIISNVLSFMHFEAMKKLSESSDEKNSKLFSNILNKIGSMAKKVSSICEKSEETCDNEHNKLTANDKADTCYMKADNIRDKSLNDMEALQTESIKKEEYILPNSIEDISKESDSDDSICFIEVVEKSATSIRKDVQEIIKKDILPSTSNSMQSESISNKRLHDFCRKEIVRNQISLDDNLPSTSNSVESDSISNEHLHQSSRTSRKIRRIKENYVVYVPKKHKLSERVTSSSAHSHQKHDYSYSSQSRSQCNNFDDRLNSKREVPYRSTLNSSRELDREDFNYKRTCHHKRKLRLIAEDRDPRKSFSDYNILDKNRRRKKVRRQNHEEKEFVNVSEVFKCSELLNTAAKLSSSVLIHLLIPKIETVKLETDEDINLWEKMGQTILSLVMDAKFKKLPKQEK